jgi:hypothetical protein
MRIVFPGFSIDWSWGNSHATNYRAPVLALRQRGHDTLFLERDAPWFAVQRDAPSAAVLYASVDELHVRHDAAVRNADLVVLGSSVPDGVAVGEWLLETARGATAFYDFDTASIRSSTPRATGRSKPVRSRPRLPRHVLRRPAGRGRAAAPRPGALDTGSPHRRRRTAVPGVGHVAATSLVAHTAGDVLDRMRVQTLPAPLPAADFDVSEARIPAKPSP